MPPESTPEATYLLAERVMTRGFSRGYYLLAQLDLPGATAVTTDRADTGSTHYRECQPRRKIVSGNSGDTVDTDNLLISTGRDEIRRPPLVA